MKISRRTAILTAASAAVAQPAFAQKSADTLRIQFVDAVPNIDMYFNSQRTGLILAHQAWDMLVHRDPSTFEIKPSLATDWNIAEDNSLDLTIRQGVKFHDGSTLSPDDVVYTINMAANPESKVATPSNYSWIDKAVKTGDWTVRIHMKRPTPAALEYLAMVTPIHPKAYREKVGPEEFAKKPVGAGPYKIVKNEQGKEVVFERFEDYWAGSPKGKPAIKTLHVRFVPDLATEVTELLAQRADWIWNINPDQIASVNKMPYLQAVQQESMRIGYLSIDAAGRSGAGNPLTNVKVQFGGQALAHLGREADACQHLVDALRDLRPPDVALGAQRHGDDVAHARQRVKRGEGVLEHRLDEAGARLAIHVDDALALDGDVAGAGFEQAEDQARQGGLAAARFADDAQHAARRHGEGHVVDRHHMAVGAQKPAFDPERLADRLDLDGGSGCAHAGSRQRNSWPGPAAWRGTAWAQVSSAKPQRSRKAQPSKPGPMRGTVPGIEPSGSSRRVLPGTGTQRSRPCVYGCFGSANSSAVAALSTTSPAYMTETRWATLATMPRSWVINSMPRPRSR